MSDKDGSRQPLPPSTPIGLRELLEATPDLVFATDAAGRFEWVNSGSERLLGMKSAELLKRNFATLIDPSRRVSEIRAFRRMALRQAPEISRVVHLVGHGDQPIILDVRVTRRERVDGELSFVGTARPYRGLGATPAVAAPAGGAAPSPELGSLKAELSSARNDKTKTAAELAKAKEEISGLKAELAKSREEIPALKAELAKLREAAPAKGDAAKETAALKAELTKVQVAHAALETDLGIKEAEVADLKAKLGDARSAISKAKTHEEDASTHKQALAEAKSELNARDEKIKSLQADLAARDKDLQTLRSDIAGNGGAAQKIRADLADREKQLEASRAELADRDAKHKSAEAELVAKHQAALADLTSKHQAAASELAAKNQATLAELTSKHQAVVAELTSKQKSLEADLVTRHQSEHADLSARHQSAQADLSARDKQIESLKADVAARDSEVQALTAEVATRDADVRALKDEMRRTMDALAAERRSLDEARAALKASQQEAANATAAAASNKSSLATQLDARTAELEARNRELEARTSELKAHSSKLEAGADEVQRLNAQLEEARAMVQLKSEFLATMSQEIRAPMTGIMGMTNLLLESELDSDQRSMVEVAQTSGRALLNLINDTIDFSRLDSDRLEIERLGFDLRVTVDEVAQLLAPLANEKGLHFDCRVHHEVPSRLIGDPGRLRQVLLNLGVCAVRTTDKNEVTMRIERLEENDERVSLRFAISDSCAGATPGFVARLYRCFAEENLALARKMGGAGLSLAVSRQLVSRMGGVAGLERRSGLGNTLWFQVPLDKQGEEVQPTVTPTAQLRGVRVLVVDPSRAARDAMVEMLTAWGCRAEALDQAEAALVRLRKAAAQGDPYGVAVIEMQLQGSSGEELGWAVRSDATLKVTRTLLTTSLGRKGDAQRAQSMGFSAYLMKPMQWSELYDALIEVLSSPAPEPGKAITTLVTRHSLAEARRGRVRVLLAEDNAVNQLVAEWALRRLGYTIELVGSATAAIEASERGHFDLILMDLQLPDMDGCKAAAAIRARERGKHTPIIGMSGHAMDGDRARCLEAGMEECLGKPIDLGQLCEMVEEKTRGKADNGTVGTGSSNVAAMIGRTMDWGATPEALAAEEPETPAETIPPTGAGTPSGEYPKLTLVKPDGQKIEDNTWTATSAAARQAKEDDPDTQLVPIDTARLEESCMGIPALRDALLQTFRADIGPRLTRLAEAIVQADPRLVEFEAHGLKGMSATIGAVACEATFEEIERLGRDEDLRNASKLLQGAQDTVERTEQFIMRLEKILSQANEAA